jgi:hypothetical protein
MNGIAPEGAVAILMMPNLNNHVLLSNVFTSSRCRCTVIFALLRARPGSKAQVVVVDNKEAGDIQTKS